MYHENICTRVRVCVCAYIPISKTMSISHPMKYLGTPTLLQAHLERDARISCPTEINQLKAHGWEGTCCQGCDDKPEFVITSSYWQVLSIYNVQYILYIYYILRHATFKCHLLQTAGCLGHILLLLMKLDVHLQPPTPQH